MTGLPAVPQYHLPAPPTRMARLPGIHVARVVHTRYRTLTRRHGFHPRDILLAHGLGTHASAEVHPDRRGGADVLPPPRSRAGRVPSWRQRCPLLAVVVLPDRKFVPTPLVNEMSPPRR